MKFQKGTLLVLLLGLLLIITGCSQLLGDDSKTEKGGVKGTVTFDGKPVSKVQVRIEDYDVSSVKTNEDGAYSFSKLPTGEYKLHFEKFTFDEFPPINTTRKVVISGSKTVTQDVKLTSKETSVETAQNFVEDLKQHGVDLSNAGQEQAEKIEADFKQNLIPYTVAVGYRMNRVGEVLNAWGELADTYYGNGPGDYTVNLNNLSAYRDMFWDCPDYYIDGYYDYLEDYRNNYSEQYESYHDYYFAEHSQYDSWADYVSEQTGFITSKSLDSNIKSLSTWEWSINFVNSEEQVDLTIINSSELYTSEIIDSTEYEHYEKETIDYSQAELHYHHTSAADPQFDWSLDFNFTSSTTETVHGSHEDSWKIDDPTESYEITGVYPGNDSAPDTWVIKFDPTEFYEVTDPEEVYLVGDMNDWNETDTSYSLTEQDNGVWRIEIDTSNIDPTGGDYDSITEFQFVADGTVFPWDEVPIEENIKEKYEYDLILPRKGNAQVEGTMTDSQTVTDEEEILIDLYQEGIYDSPDEIPDLPAIGTITVNGAMNLDTEDSKQITYEGQFDSEVIDYNGSTTIDFRHVPSYQEIHDGNKAPLLESISSSGEITTSIFKINGSTEVGFVDKNVILADDSKITVSLPDQITYTGFYQDISVNDGFNLNGNLTIDPDYSDFTIDLGRDQLETENNYLKGYAALRGELKIPSYEPVDMKVIVTRDDYDHLTSEFEYNYGKDKFIIGTMGARGTEDFNLTASNHQQLKINIEPSEYSDSSQIGTIENFETGDVYAQIIWEDGQPTVNFSDGGQTSLLP